MHYSTLTFAPLLLVRTVFIRVTSEYLAPSANSTTSLFFRQFDFATRASGHVTSLKYAFGLSAPLNAVNRHLHPFWRTLGNLLHAFTSETPPYRCPHAES